MAKTESLPPENPTVRYLTKQQAAEHLQITQRTLESWMSRRLVSFFRIGRTIRFRSDDLDKTLEANSRVASR